MDLLVNFSSDSKVTLMKYVHIINDLRKFTGKKVDLVEEGQLKAFAVRSAERDKILVYERKAQGYHEQRGQMTMNYCCPHTCQNNFELLVL